jgi:hypothetical protein
MSKNSKEKVFDGPPPKIRAAPAYLSLAEWLRVAEMSWGLVDVSQVLTSDELKAVRDITARVQEVCVKVLAVKE